MQKSLFFGTVTLLCSLLAIPVAYAHQYYDDQNGDSHYYRHTYRYDHHKIQHLRAKIERNQAERERVLRIYNHARHTGDWATVRFERSRLDQLDREIQRDRYELQRAYKKARWDRDERGGEWHDRYGYQRDRY
ncbi:MAG TPA: hypothetical protein PKY50_03520 [Candidatus Competibacter sp.]|nr:hypothetical protein [Candidatus Competibacter sp.]